MDVLIVLGLLGCTIAAALTVPAGFGLATMTTPIFLIWFEPHQAIAGVAIVHGAHNAIKAQMLCQHIDREALMLLLPQTNAVHQAIALLRRRNPQRRRPRHALQLCHGLLAVVTRVDPDEEEDANSVQAERNLVEVMLLLRRRCGDSKQVEEEDESGSYTSTPPESRSLALLSLIHI